MLQLRLVVRSVGYLLCLAAAACSGGGGGGASEPSRLLVSADTAPIEATGGSVPNFDRRLLEGRPIAEVYRLTTPAAEPFAFDLTSWLPGLSGAAGVAVKHLAADGRTPNGDGSLAAAGIEVRGTALGRAGAWVSAGGEGFARLRIAGTIDAPQVLCVSVDADASGRAPVAVIALDLGPRSAITRPDADAVDPPVGMTRQTLYSSAASQFGMPTVAVSGDRTSIVCYEGDQLDPWLGPRYELRLQHDAVTGAVTGGATQLAEAWASPWRDHEIAALFNVLAVARAETGGVRLRLSFDRGATFAQDALFPIGDGASRLVQIAMAADYSLAMVYWREAANRQALECVLVEGQPVAFDGYGSPTWFAFPSQEVLWQMPIDGTPLTSGIAWSDGGDLAIGYGGAWFVPGTTWTSVAEFRCSTRRYGELRRDRLVEQNRIVAMDPSVAVTGSGGTLQVYYAYETQDGVRLAHSADGGDTFAVAATFGHPGDHQPTVCVRPGTAEPRVDVLYLAARNEGLELHATQWPNGLAGPSQTVRLVGAASVVAPGVPLPGGDPTNYVSRTTQVGWMGYDAVVDGDRLTVVVDEVTYDHTAWVLGIPVRGELQIFGPQVTTAGGFRPSAPPPFAPGLTEPLRSPVAADAHQLLLLRVP